MNRATSTTPPPCVSSPIRSAPACARAANETTRPDTAVTVAVAITVKPTGGAEVPHVHLRADRDPAGREEGGNGAGGRHLHQIDHQRRAEFTPHRGHNPSLNCFA